ncbi:MAG: type IV pilus modification protein PilV [Gammaproteobacteria bacterium]
MRTSHSRPAQSGFTLLEVLISVFVLSIGLLGIAGLQMTSKRTNYEAVQRTNATMLAQELLERIRANTPQLTIYSVAGAGRTIDL